MKILFFFHFVNCHGTTFSHFACLWWVFGSADRMALLPVTPNRHLKKFRMAISLQRIIWSTSCFVAESLCGYSRGLTGEGGSNNSGEFEKLIFYAFGRYVFGTLGNVVNKDMRRRTVKTVIRRKLRIGEGIADLSQTKSCGRYIVWALANKANISI